MAFITATATLTETEVSDTNEFYSNSVVLNFPNATTFIIAPHAVVTPAINLFSLLLHNSDFATVMNSKYLICMKGAFDPRLRTTVLTQRAAALAAPAPCDGFASVLSLLPAP